MSLIGESPINGNCLSLNELSWLQLVHIQIQTSSNSPPQHTQIHTLKFINFTILLYLFPRYIIYYSNLAATTILLVKSKSTYMYIFMFFFLVLFTPSRVWIPPTMRKSNRAYWGFDDIMKCSARISL